MFVRGGKLFKMPSNEYRAWHKQASEQLKEQSPSLFNATGVSSLGKELHLKFFAPDLRKSDMTNKAESVMDLLVDNHFIVDDNWFEVNKLLLEFGGVDRENPRVEIYG